MSETRVDTAVVGLGAMGAATLYQLARRGVVATGIDRYAPPHTMGSSHGETRITRCAVGEGDAYVPFVLRSHAIWRELEAETGETLLDTCGLLMLAPRGARTGHHGKADFLQRTIAVAERHEIAHRLLDSAEIAARFPAFIVRHNEEAYFEPGGGILHPERCIAAQLAGATARGASVLTGRTVRHIEQQAGRVVVQTDTGTIIADRVVVAAGAWTGKLLGGRFAATLAPYRQVLHWFPVLHETPHLAGNCPAYIWLHGGQPEEYFYGFPAFAGSGEVKVATEQYGAACDPDTVDREVTMRERDTMFTAHVSGRLAGVQARPAHSAACLYTVTPERGFVIDRHPGKDRIIVVSACSGHGFKHSAAIGESVAQLICEGRSEIDLQPFGLELH